MSVEWSLKALYVLKCVVCFVGIMISNNFFRLFSLALLFFNGSLFFYCTAAVAENDFPTLDRVQFVYECMALKGGENYTNLYGCSCTLDKIAQAMSYSEYVEADSYMRMENMRGERGGLFRNSSEKARGVRKKFLQIKGQAERACTVKNVNVAGSQ